MTRNDMRRLVDATDDPRLMSVSLRPLNKQLSMKNHEKKEEKQDEKNSVSQEMKIIFF